MLSRGSHLRSASPRQCVGFGMAASSLMRGMLLAMSLVVSLAVAGMAASSAVAQDLKFQGPVKILVGFAAGGQSDILARVIADKLKERLGHAVVVENKTGAGGRLAVEATKSSPADGSVLVLANVAQMSVAPSIFKDLPYDPLRDFTAIARVVDFQIALATGKQTGTKAFKEALAWLKANPDKANSGNPGNGSLPHLYGFELAAATGLKLQPVPYRGGAPIVAALTQGELAVGWGGLTDFIEQHRSGQVNIIAVTGKARSAQLPDVPTFSELGFPSVATNGWIGLFGPVGLPEAVAARLQRETVAVLADPGVNEKLVALGLIVAPSTAGELKSLVAADLAKWQPVIEKAEIKP